MNDNFRLCLLNQFGKTLFVEHIANHRCCSHRFKSGSAVRRASHGDNIMSFFNEHRHKLAPYCARPSSNKNIHSNSSFLYPM
jgi:hypothetical protein